LPIGVDLRIRIGLVDEEDISIRIRIATPENPKT